MKNLLFGYGSIINAQTMCETLKRSISPIGVAYLKGPWQRSWNVRVEEQGRQLLALGLQPDKQSDLVSGLVSGLIYEIDDSDFAHMDKREETKGSTPLYDRVTFKEIHCQLVAKGLSEEQRRLPIYTYLPASPVSPTGCVPQSYLDTIIAGCLSISQEFAHDFVTHTVGMLQVAVVRDRKRKIPYYPRSLFIGDSMYLQIDEVLTKAGVGLT